MQQMYPGKVNSPQTELSAAIDATQDTIPLLDASVLPAPPNLATLGTGEDAETVLYTGINGNTLTGVTRGFQGTAKAWAAGTKVARLFTAYDWDSARQNIEDHETRIDQNTAAMQQVAAALDEHKNETAPHGATASVVANSLALRDAKGQVVGLVPAVSVFHNLIQSIPNDTQTVLSFNGEKFDTDGMHDLQNNSRLTCQTTGKYLIVGTVYFSQNPNGYREAKINLNGTTTIAIERKNAVQATSLQNPITVITIYNLSIGDYVELIAYQNSGAALNITEALFTMLKVGE